MILNPAYFREVLLPAKLKESLAKYFPDGTDSNVIVTAYDGHDKPILSSQKAHGQNDEIKINLPYFYNYKVGIRSRHMTPEQWAHWNFNYSLSLSLLMTAVLIGGIVLALRTASREMRLSQMKADFVSNVSHELRTPLASIRVFGEFMKLGRVTDDSKIREYGEHIETESRRLTQLINNILDFSRIESAEKKYRFNDCDAGAIITDVLSAFEVPLRERGFDIVVEIAPSLPRVRIDRESIAQALVNLFDNAVKYSGERKEIGVRAFVENGELRIAVQDHGIGIAMSEQKKIFEKFYRVGSGLVHDVKGSGLGLAIVSHIVKAHGGRVEVTSAPGDGTTFTIVLPCRPAEEPAAASNPTLENA